MKTKKLIQLRQEAQNAVFDMEEGELKIKAFEILLTHLLNSEEPLDSAKEGGLVATTREDQKLSKKASNSVTSKTGRILMLKNEDYFRELRTISEVREELASRGWHYPLSALSGPLQELVQRRELRRQKMQHGKKRVWKYSNP